MRRVQLVHRVKEVSEEKKVIQGLRVKEVSQEKKVLLVQLV